MAVPVGCWPNANAANSSRRRAPGLFFGLFFERAPCPMPHPSSMRPNAAPIRPQPCTGGFRSDPSAREGGGGGGGGGRVATSKNCTATAADCGLRPLRSRKLEVL
jgi:hypothetical protein